MFSRFSCPKTSSSDIVDVVNQRGLWGRSHPRWGIKELEEKVYKADQEDRTDKIDKELEDKTDKVDKELKVKTDKVDKEVVGGWKSW